MKHIKRNCRSVLIFLLLISAIGYAITQPTWQHNSLSKAKVDPDQLKAHVFMLSTNFYPRSCFDRGNLDKCAAYIQNEFESAGAVVTNQTYLANGRSYQNIIARFPGTNPERIVIGAHYDTCDDTPGADDNASGIAGLLDLARLLRNIETHRTIELVAYCTEEPPFFGTEDMGSAHHAKSLHEQNVHVKAMLALEMIGYFSDAKASQSYPAAIFRLFYPSKGNFIAIIGNTKQRELVKAVKVSMRGTTALPIHSVSVPHFVSGIDFSDHRNYWRYGFPAVMITDTAFLRNKQYHKLGDTPDRLDYSRMADVVTAVFETIKKLDEQP